MTCHYADSRPDEKLPECERCEEGTTLAEARDSFAAYCCPKCGSLYDQRLNAVPRIRYA